VTMAKRGSLTLLLGTLLWLVSTPGLSRATKLDLTSQQIPLPGPPAAVVPADMNGDGRLDLAVVVVFTEWDQIEISEYTTMDQIEGLVEVMTIVPALADRRELRVFLAEADGGYRAAGPPAELTLDVISLMVGPPGIPLLALTDRGLDRVRLDEGGRLTFEPIVDDPPVLAGTGVFLPDLRLVHDLTGDGLDDVILPAPDGIALYAGNGHGVETTPRWRLALPGDESFARGRSTVRQYPLPEVRDVSGDGRPDLVWLDPQDGWEGTSVQVALPGGGFAAPVVVTLAARESDEERIVHVGDLDGDGRAEITTQEVLELEDEDPGMRAEIHDAEAPRNVFRLYRVDTAVQGASTPYVTFSGLGYAFETDSDDEIQLPGGFFDINGDGREDLVTLTLQLSITKMLGSLATKRISLPIDFHVWCQQADGSLTPVTGLDLSGKFKIHFDDLRLRSMPMFAGDFDGDHRLDFVQLGRGRTMGIHAGREDCSYPATPDLVVKLRAEPANVELVRIRDLNGDGRSDVMIVQPGESREADVTAPITLDLYLSGGPS